jgi:hypothetical protein
MVEETPEETRVEITSQAEAALEATPEVPAEGWALGSVAGLDFHFARQVDDPEREELLCAARLLRSLYGGFTYPAAAAAIEDFIQRVQALAFADGVISGNDRDQVGRSFLTALRVLTHVPDRIIETLAAEAADSIDSTRVSEMVQTETASSRLDLARRLAQADDSVSAEIDRDGGRLRVVFEIGSERVDNPVELLVEAADAVQLIIARALLIAEPLATELSTMLRQRTAEILTGAPTLIAYRMNTEDNAGRLRGMTPHELALDLITPLQQIFRQSARLVESLDQTDGASPDGKEEESAHSDDEILPEREAAEPTGVEEDVEEEEEPKPSDGDDEKATLPVGVTDVRSAISHLKRLSERLEHRWSEALDDANETEDRRAEWQQWLQLVAGLAHAGKSGDRRVADAGHSTNLPAELLSLDPSVIEDSPADLLRAWQQVTVAFVMAIEQLVQTAAGACRPSNVVMDLTTGTSQSWWESGAFALIGAKARLVLRLHDLKLKLEDRIASQDDSERSDDSPFTRELDLLLLTSDARAHGDPEAALLHQVRALRLFLQRRVAGISIDDLIEALEGSEGFVGDAVLLRRADDLVASLASDPVVDLSLVVLTVEGLNRFLRRLMYGEDEALWTVVRQLLGDEGK